MNTQKLLLPLVAFFVMTACATKTDLDSINSRLDNLENVTITGINAQIKDVKASISKLEDADLKLKQYITDLQSEDIEIEGLICDLQVKQEHLSYEIYVLLDHVVIRSDDLKKWVEDNYVTLEKFNALSGEVSGIKSDLVTINSKIKDLEDKTGEIINDLSSCQESIENIVKKMDALEYSVDSLGVEISRLIAKVQSATVVPTYSDGSVKLNTKGESTLKFEVRPLAVAEEIAKVGKGIFFLTAVETETKATGDFIEFPVTDVSFDGKTLNVETNTNDIQSLLDTEEFNLNLRLLISNENTELTSEYFPVVFMP